MTASIKSVALFAVGALARGQHLLAPESNINNPRGQNAKEPLRWLGANGPWFPGENVNGISSEVPEGCTVEQAAYISRHGSRYPDTGAYNGWVEAHKKYSAGGYTAHGALSFLPSWKPVLENPSIQIAMENPTGMKEAYDYGYQLRTRYPEFYKTGDEFVVWANNYTRVLQTAEKFVHGYLGAFASTNGSVISVTGKGFPEALGDTLAPSDMCPTFKDTSGSDQVAAWDNVWIPRVQKRLQAMIRGNLTLEAGDISQGPYLCGYESAITGRLSPWCDVFTDEEFRQYEYENDLRYYYGLGPGSDVAKKMMTPYLNALIDLLQRGPGIEGIREDGIGRFKIPQLLVSFLNDGQLTELVTASGVFDAQKLLNPKKKDDRRMWVGNRYVTMRGTIAFERLSCKARNHHAMRRWYPTRPVGQPVAYVRVLLNDAVYPIPSCQNGPGRSCLLDEYVEYVEKKMAKEGDWLKTCNVTDPKAPAKVKGASFYTDLSSPWLQRVAV